jgi:hypothetical protein
MSNELRVRDSDHFSPTESILVALVGYYGSSNFEWLQPPRKAPERGHPGNTCNPSPEPSGVVKDPEFAE